MGEFRKAIFARARWLAVFTLLLLVSSAVPVLAETSPAPEAPGSPADLAALPDGEQVATGMAKADELAAEEEQAREAPAAVAEREASALAFSEISPAEAEALLAEVFAAELASIDQDPARMLSDVQLEQPLGPTDARVSVDGDTVLVDGTIPVRTAGGDGELSKVDLDLVPDGDGFAPANPLTEVTLPGSSAGAIRAGEEGFAIEPVLARPASAARLLEGEDVFYPETQTDTDLLAVPLSRGVELFSLLRSVESPEELRFEITLPEDAALREDGEGGAEVVRDGKRLIRIPAPVAFDAQKADVPVRMSVEASSLILGVAHRGMDLAYPLLVDPIAEDWSGAGNNWHSGAHLSALTDGTWLYNTTNWGRFEGDTYSPAPGLVGGSERGLFIAADPTSPETQWAYQSAQWSYTVPGSSTYITDAGVSPFWRFNLGCGAKSYPQPHDFIGLWSPAWSGQYGWMYHQPNAAEAYGYAFAKPPTDWRKYTAQVLILGFGTGIYNTAAIPCSRFLYAGGAYVWMDDLEKPSIGTVSGIPGEAWLGAEKQLIGVPASDAGLGVRFVTMTIDGGTVIKAANLPACTGLRSSLCPAGITAQFDPTNLSFPEGIRGVSVQAEDPTGKTSETTKFQVRVDHGAPEVTLSGQLAKATDEEGSDKEDTTGADDLSLPVYKMLIDAKDGSKVEPSEMRSGVKSIEVSVDDEESEVLFDEDCPPAEGSCSKAEYYRLELPGVSSGLHTLKVRVVDQAGNERKRNIEFEYFPATGMRDEYVMHYFPLPDGLGDEESEEHPARPELAVNVMNGNLVYRERDFEVQGASVDLEVERYYNSQLPDAENTEWGDGWTLAQTPELDPAEGASEAEILDSSGALADGVELPEKAGESEFDPELQATIVKEADGGYEMVDETGESATSVAFNEDGRAEALRTEGYAKVDYAYEAGELSEISVEDPATFAADPEELEEIPSGLIEAPTYSSSFGKSGSTDGQLKSPADVAVDSAGNLWVADKANNRIQKFSPDGKFLAKFGTLGSGNGQLSAPAALAVDSAGNIWVVDSGNRRVQKFNPQGEYLAKFGSQGSGNGQFSSWGSRGIAIDAQGNLWVSDYSGRVQKFNGAGEFIKAVGSSGSGNGQFGQSAGLDVGGGKVWIGDWSNNRVSVFTEAGEFLFSFGLYGTGNGQFNHPDTVEVDAKGNVWVGDQANHRIQQFDPEAKYIRQFGSYGAGPGQFSFTYPLGIETDGKGRLWVADVSNHRVQEWLVPIESPVYADSFGSKGSGDGQLSSPADVAVGLGGNLWVADKANNRIEKFSPDGKFLAKFGSSGSGDGQFSSPAGIAVDRDGNLLVLDRGNNRVQKFDPEGNFLLKFGSAGSGNGQLSAPEAIAADFAGNVWVCDTANGRIQRFDEEGKFVETVGSKGSGEGQFGECTGIDVDPEGRVWAGDWVNNRVNVFSSEGKYLFRFGSSGSGSGQFNHPDAIEVDAKGNVFVGDQSNNRVQQFDSEAKYIRQFGSYGAGPGQFSFTYPLGIETDAKGHLWVADVNNHRIQRWLIANYASVPAGPIELTDGDPAVEVEAEGGLIASVGGNAAGEHSYEHEGELLVAHEGPEGETVYDYDEDRLTHVELPNGTKASIAYHADGRVKSVTVDPAGEGEAKTTWFAYSDDPRRTTVEPPDSPTLTYDIGDDGSVLKWWNKNEPPVLELAGTLYDYREDDGALWSGDHTLESEAWSAEGIASIKVIANGNTLVSEETCEQEHEKEEIECVNPPIIDQWVTSTDLHAPGHLQVEVIATDHKDESSSERFWVDIPEPPQPPAPGSPVPPKFRDIAEFREEYGLEVVFPVKSERQLNERIFNLINAWYEGDPVARSSAEKWGVPLRPADVAEMEYREWYTEANGPLIDDWGYTHFASTYAGYQVDHRSGGIIRIGFTQGQQLRVNEFLQQVNPSAPDRFSVFQFVPTQTRQSLESLETEVSSVANTDPVLSSAVSGVGISDLANSITVETTDVVATQQRLMQLFGVQNGITVTYQSEPPESQAGRDRQTGRMLAGDRLWTDWAPSSKPLFTWGTAGFGAYEDAFISEENRWVRARFLLAAGHMGSVGALMYRISDPSASDADKRKNGRMIGAIERNARFEGSQRIDALAMRFNSEGLEPRKIFGSNGKQPLVGLEGVAHKGQTLCVSGARTERTRCGEVIKIKYVKFPTDPKSHGVLVVDGLATRKGDSGAPVWNPRTRAAIGILSGGHEHGTISYVQPLLDTPKGQNATIPGALHDPVMGDLHIATAG